jgi:Holliday junction DNA helicase RuvA
VISCLEGLVVYKRGDVVVVSANGVGYEVLLPGAVAHELANLVQGDTVTLYTSLHLTATPNRVTPLLVGFTNPVEREFFEQFITVSGIGPKAAAKSLTLPFARVARAIIEGDDGTLCLLPGIGKKRADEIIHQLKDKVGSAALLKEYAPAEVEDTTESLLIAASAVLRQLGYRQTEVQRMVDLVRDNPEGCETVEELLGLIYARLDGKRGYK